MATITLNIYFNLFYNVLWFDLQIIIIIKKQTKQLITNFNTNKPLKEKLMKCE